MESKRKINAAAAVQDEVERALKRRKVLSADAMRLEPVAMFGRWTLDLFRTNAPTDERGFLLRATEQQRGARLTIFKDHIDLSKGESAELTTEHGLKLVDTLRRTEDKRQASSFSYCEISSFAHLHHDHPVSLVYG
ncbi:hypothetical protein LOCC1_G000441 [Lachnellula occidentalis]|uniref:Uncharacterized protein n=1 Tax=Lachnellula occidentalis TaxID=215460 RepID=A0A8H8UKQ6_9HELO|nr:hypothetical protein LOCC1_G000441 [Lachnellula occidentalis]